MRFDDRIDIIDEEPEDIMDLNKKQMSSSKKVK
jgi:hypothetical protein